nr:hypothetical protein [Tanacetum cinerariifolium]
MFTDEHALDYSSPPIYNEYDDDLFKFESDTENIYDDPFDSKGEKIKESKLLIDELDLPCDFFLLSSIHIQESLFEIITRVAKDKKLAISHASLVIEDFDPLLYELPFSKKFPDSMPEMFTDEHTLDYSSPPIYDEYDDDLFKVESDTENVYDDPFDSRGEKIKESKLLIDE